MEDEPTPEEVDLVRRYLDAENDRRTALEQNEYDGILGIPPTWVPEPTVEKFRQVRDRVIFDWCYTPGQAIEWINRYCRIGQYGDDWFYPGCYPCGRELDSDYFLETFGLLANLRWAVSLGPKEGLTGLSGKDAARGYKITSSASEGGKERARIFSQDKNNVREIAKQICEERTRKPSQRELARLVVRKLYPELTGKDAEKRADSIRHQLM